MTSEINVGTIVKFAKCLEAGDESSRFKVIELRGDRALVEFVCDLKIKPTSVYPLSDLTPAED